ncbi:MAG TPA: hypothetical protein IAB63_10220 [Candidatus Onthocola gallistercoris]|uniref:Uncharacterized protein n=1 Tax=Candidatus Onthocola gallistercoris TaxID=2840876 RepID=A0A9D1HHY2_9FIRM|nr:hypothetical protein [Candidatus Onthocola gallistercoris]
MLDKEKIRIMSRCAIYEKGQGKADLQVNKYYQGDYVRLNVLKSLIGVSVAFVLCVGLYMVVRAEYFMEHIVSMDIMAFIMSILKWYVIVLVAFGVISTMFYMWKYADSIRRVRGYYKDLKSLEKMEENRSMRKTTEDEK